MPDHAVNNCMPGPGISADITLWDSKNISHYSNIFIHIQTQSIYQIVYQVRQAVPVIISIVYTCIHSMQLLLSENSHLLFSNNFAEELGAGLYVEFKESDFVLSILNTGCFIRYNDPASADLPPNQWVTYLFNTCVVCVRINIYLVIVCDPLILVQRRNVN